MRIGFAVCGSFCTIPAALDVLGRIAGKGDDIIPIMSTAAVSTDTRFGLAADIAERIRCICDHRIISSLAEAEPLGPREPLDLLIICPCTGNTLAKLARGITDTPVTMAAKAHLRGDRPLLIAAASNDAMSANLQSIATLLCRKHVFFVPLIQDDPVGKPHSLVADFARIPEAAAAALDGRQLRPLFI